MNEVTALIKALLPEEQVKKLRRYKRCECEGIPPVNAEGDVVVCDYCDGTGYYEVLRKYYAITDSTKHLPTVIVTGVGELAYVDIE